MGARGLDTHGPDPQGARPRRHVTIRRTVGELFRDRPLTIVPISNLIVRDQSIQISRGPRGPRLAFAPSPYGRQGRGGDRCPGRPAGRRAAGPRRHGRPRLPARRRLRRPAARRHPAVDPRDPHPGGAAGLRARPGHRGQLGRRPRQGVHQHRRQGVHHRDGRLRPHREGRHPRSGAGHRLLVPLLGRRHRLPGGAHPHRAGGGTRGRAGAALRRGLLRQLGGGLLLRLPPPRRTQRPRRLAASRRLHLRVQVR